MSYKFEYTFPDHIKGDTFTGVKFDLSDVQRKGENLDLVGASALMELRAMHPNGTLVDSFSDGAGITIDEGNTTITFDEQVVNVDVALYHYSIKIILDGGEILTYIGGTWEICINPTI